MFKFILLTCAVCGLFFNAQGATALVPERVETISSQPSIMTFRVSLLDATRRMATVSGSLTAIRPVEIGFGLSSSILNSYFVNAGVALPWDKQSYIFNDRMVKELFVVAGYMLEEKGPFYGQLETNPYYVTDPNRPDQLHAFTFQAGFEAIEWINPYIGLDLRLALGIKYWITEWAGTSPMTPVTDISLGIAF